jgi:hypothetical protein
LNEKSAADIEYRGMIASRWREDITYWQPHELCQLAISYPVRCDIRALLLSLLECFIANNHSDHCKPRLLQLEPTIPRLPITRIRRHNIACFVLDRSRRKSEKAKTYRNCRCGQHAGNTRIF